MATQSTDYSLQSLIAVTSLNNLADGAFACSAIINNSSTLALQLAVGGIVVNGTGTGAVRVYALAQTDPTDANSVTGGYGAFAITDAVKAGTIFEVNNLPLLTTIDYSGGVSKASRWGPYTLEDVFGFAPEKSGLLFENATGQALAASGHVLDLTSVKTTVV